MNKLSFTALFQWGRALRADCVADDFVTIVPTYDMFQWGRALRADCVVAVNRGKEVGTGICAFQWGRALRADCVVDQFKHLAEDGTCFNGAALYARIVSREEKEMTRFNESGFNGAALYARIVSVTTT